MLVVSRGDEQIVRLEGHRGWHFPRHEDGRFAGFHPQDSQAAITHLEELRSKGAEYLVFPETALWWLDYYGDFREHLESRYRVMGESESCLIYDVSSSPEVDLERDAAAGAGEPKRSSSTPVGGVVAWLLPPEARIGVLSADGTGLAGLDPQRTVQFQPGDDDSVPADLERLFDQGVEFLVIPNSAFAWLELRPALRQHLRMRHRFVTRQRHICEIYELTSDG